MCAAIYVQAVLTVSVSVETGLMETTGLFFLWLYNKVTVLRSKAGGTMWMFTQHMTRAVSESSPPHLREFLVFVRETVDRVVEHFLHETFLIIWNKDRKR